MAIANDVAFADSKNPVPFVDFRILMKAIAERRRRAVEFADQRISAVVIADGGVGTHICCPLLPPTPALYITKKKNYRRHSRFLSVDVE